MVTDDQSTTAPARHRAPVRLEASDGAEFTEVLRALQTKSGLSHDELAERAQLQPGTIERLLDPHQTQLPSNVDEIVALARACGMSLPNLERLAELWNQLNEGLSGKRSAEAMREAYAEYRAARKKVDGRWVSTLLGTDGYPNHGDLAGYRVYGCQCEVCTSVHASRWSQWETEKRTTERYAVAIAVLEENWPGQGAADEEELRETAGAVIDRWASARRYRVGPVSKVLAEYWPTIDEETAKAIAEDLVDALATTSRRNAKGAPRDTAK